MKEKTEEYISAVVAIVIVGSLVGVFVAVSLKLIGWILSF